ncbi:MAG: hypothetical protein IJ785_08590 [Bacteroidales bacterium]|nr:hypothetical protein [Bacteroidales bacterium]
MRNRIMAFLLLSAAVGTVSCHGQNINSPDTKGYPFVRYESNELRYDSTSAAMRYLLNKMRRVATTGQGTVNIVHIGGSHVQAGVFPNQVRVRMMQRWPQAVGGRGMVFPYSAAAKCNNPDDYRVHCKEKVVLTRNVYKEPEYPLGLCGISVTAKDVPTRIQMLLTDKSVDYRVQHIVVLGYSPQGVLPTLGFDGNEMEPSYVDTATHRYVFNLLQPVDSFDIVLPCSEGQTFTLTGVCLGNRRPGFSYHSIGVNGAAVPDYLKCNLTSDLRLLRPDLVIFGIGINDAHEKTFDTVVFKNNYLALCDSIRKVNPKCAFIFVTNNDSYRKTGRRRYAVNTNGPLARDVFYRLAELTGGAVWDQFEIMGGLKSMEKWQKAGLAQKDKVHFTRAGYRLMGDLFFNALYKELYKLKIEN